MSESTQMTKNGSPELMSPQRTLVPAVDILENPEEIVMLVDVPGVVSDTLNLRVEDGRMDLEARQKLPADAERFVEPVTFARSFTLPSGVDDAKVAAELHDGVLRIRLPKAEHAKPRRIPVKAS